MQGERSFGGSSAQLVWVQFRILPRSHCRFLSVVPRDVCDMRSRWGFELPVVQSQCEFVFWCLCVRDALLPQLNLSELPGV